MKEDHRGNRQDFLSKVPIDEKIGRIFGNEPVEENLCMLGVL